MLALLIVCLAGCAPVAGVPDTIVFRFLPAATAEGIDEVCCAQPSRFTGPAVASVTAGFGGSPIWIALPALAAGSVVQIARQVDEAILYERDDAAGTWIVSRSGDTVDRRGGALAEPGVAFALSSSLPDGAARVLWVAQPTAVSIGLRAWSPAAFRAKVERGRVVRAVLGGFVGAILLYNLLVAVFARDRVFALNAASIGCIALIDLYLSGYGVRYLWSPAWSNTVMNVALAALVFFSSSFLRRFLGAERSPARRFRLMRALGYAAPVLPAASLVLPYWVPQLALLAWLLAVVGLGFASTLALAWAGEPRARLLAVPFGLVIVPGGVLATLRTVDDFPLEALNEHTLGVTLACEALAFSLALAARIRVHAAEAGRARQRLAQFEIRAADQFSEFQDRERARISSELHDSVGHDLVMITGALERIRGADPQDASLVDNARQLARRSLREVRRLSRAIHPSTLEHLGWRDSVAALFAELEQLHGVAVVVDQPAEEPRLAPRRRIDLYRVLQELVTNVAKHSDASECRVTIRYDDGTFRCEVRDDGVGLDDTEPAASGLGFQSIEHRMRRLGGSWVAMNAPEGGLVVRIEAPLEPA